MFFLLAVCLCAATSFIVVSFTSIACSLSIRRISAYLASAPPVRAAHLLFVLRMLPLASVSIVTLGFVLPAFLEFEPESTSEGIGMRLALLALAGLLVLLFFAGRSIRIILATRNAQKKWLTAARQVLVPGVSVPIFEVIGSPSLLAVVGIVRPKIFVARAILQALTPNELFAALAHEVAHVRSFDNLKQFLLRITRPPFWLSGFYRADLQWSGLSEIAADQAAVTRGASPLELSSALVKVTGFAPVAMSSQIRASHLVPSNCGTSLEARISRLQYVLEHSDLRQETYSGAMSRRMVFVCILVLFTYALSAQAILPVVHEALELLVR